ncbi:hypothetical protein ACFSCX_20510 [Bacillus salitolerans]|uniref:GAPS4 PD-(D/E)XK nuclease domain-containing protein n=1 Tax=Bacillus salitolerans TaxID=1437434 RepID=A0ABW4LUV8_9BACI
MAGGEFPKKLGEYGEKIVQKILPLIGYNSVINNFDIKCYDNEEHKRTNAKGHRQSHGVDHLFSYNCPLRDNTIENVIISAKYQDNYPDNEKEITENFKKFSKEIVQTMQCIDYSEEYTQRIASPQLHNPDIKKTGVIFWLANDDSIDSGVIEKIENFRMEDLNFESIYLVDNKRANFIFLVLNFIKLTYGNTVHDFYYPDTGYNHDPRTKKYSGSILPVQFINSNIIPIKLQTDSKTLLLFINENFNDENLRRMMGLAHNFTRNFSGNVIIHFPDYGGVHHVSIVEKVKSNFTDQNFVGSVSVKSFLLNVNTLGDE